MFNQNSKLALFIFISIILPIVNIGCSTNHASTPKKYHQIVDLAETSSNCLFPTKFLEELIYDYFTALQSQNMEFLSSLFSDDYLDDGVNKQEFLDILTLVAGVIDDSDGKNFCIYRAEPHPSNPDLYIVEIRWNFHAGHFWMGSQSDMIRRENGKWKWYGNQRKK